MQLRLATLGLLAAALVPAEPAAACGIALQSAGTLAPSADYVQLGSSELGGAAATFIVSNTLGGGDFRVTVTPPVLAAAPAGFNQASAQLSYAYTGAGLLNYVSQSYTTAQTHFDVSGLLGALAVVITLQNRISNPNGFASGTYQTTTVITCS